MSSGGGVNKVPLRWHGKVILMPAPYYCYNVTSEAGVWWVGVMPLGAMAGSQRSKKRSAYKHARVRLRGRPYVLRADSHAHTHTNTFECVCLCEAIINTHTKAHSTGGYNDHPPRGKYNGNTSHRNKQVKCEPNWNDREGVEIVIGPGLNESPRLQEGATLLLFLCFYLTLIKKKKNLCLSSI